MDTKVLYITTGNKDHLKVKEKWERYVFNSDSMPAYRSIFRCNHCSK